MLVLLACFVIMLVGIGLNERDPYDGVGFVLAFISGACVVIGLLMVPASHMSTHARIAEIQAVAETAAQARAAGDAIEGAAFRMEIADANAWIASQKYWNGTVFGLWVPDVVDALAPIT